MEKDFEKELSHKLNQRTIEPSSNAWERVNLQRGKTKKRPTYIRYWIAALFVLGLGILWMQIGNQETEIPTEIVKSENNPSKPAQTKAGIELPEPSAKEQIATITPRKTEIAEPANTQTAKPELPKQQTLTLASADVRRHGIEDKITSTVVLMIDSGKKVDADDVDLLIEKARKEIAAGNGLSKRTDATALLKDSESEIDENFRTGVLENLFKHKKIKVALSSH
ncbi:hypothetical protein HUK80_17105 [Flavobacterium sp. MAH-1]|uniref:Uncharacterized protein n=1 Tax=Flavobacterium agri TaxID=2743471 RepID=A0A7Y9C7R2_9FLAO|nr:hypothetical protein [Flavobacterium agri]NUY82626.1 hypothetical protein [Flavobacterium agri]NYA72649.1 hypothetical protein [Flavobacterium agri]